MSYTLMQGLEASDVDQFAQLLSPIAAERLRLALNPPAPVVQDESEAGQQQQAAVVVPVLSVSAGVSECVDG